MLHHKELEMVLDKDSFHECQACKELSMCLSEYAEHISTAQHKANLKRLMSTNVKQIPLFKTLSKETIDRILERNRTLKKNQKKAKGKRRKKHAEMVQGAARKNTATSRKVNMRTLKQMQETHQMGSNSAVVQNKENKVFSLQSFLHQREAALQNQSGRVAGLSGEPAGRTWHQAFVPDQFPQLSHSQCTGLQSQTERVFNRPYNISQHDYRDRLYNSATDFTSDHLPLSGAIIFGHDQNESAGPPRPKQEGPHCSANPASSSKAVSAAPVRDADVSVMLRQIRRALGVREPCRADREARRQSSEAGVRVADGSPARQAGAEKEELPGAAAAPPQVSTPARAAHPGACPSSTAPAKPKPEMTQGALDSPTSLSRFMGKTTSTEPKSYTTHKVRIAHKSSKTQGGKEAALKPTLNKLLTASGAKGKLSWNEMYGETKRKRQDTVKGVSRFGIELTNPATGQESSTQPLDNDLPLSEGFHWESFPDSPSGPNLTLPPPPQDTSGTDSHREIQSDSQMQEPGTAEQDEGGLTVAAVKVEPNPEDEKEGLRDSSSANKRKYDTIIQEDGVSDKEPSGKKMRAKSNKDQDQMDRLLAVSLREDELSHSLQDLDRSLVQARNALQAAYAVVQRLLLLRQQFTAEVNSLRAKRIEILQGMQEGYSGASNGAGKATTSSAGAAAAVQPRHSPLPPSSAFATSSSQQTPATTSALSVTQPHPTPLALSVKQEICCLPTAGPSSHFVSSNTDALHAPLNQPVPLFPSDLLHPLLLQPPHLAAPTSAAAAASTSVSTLLSPESSARQQEQETREGLKDCVKTARLTKEEPQLVGSDSERETVNLGKEPVKGREKSVAERDQNAPVAGDDDGDASDDFVEMTEPIDLVVIDSDESDSRDSPEAVSNDPVRADLPPKRVGVQFSSASTQTFQQHDVDRKIQLPLPVKDASSPAVISDSSEDEEPSLGAFVNHTGPVHGLQVHEGLLYTCSGDNTARAYSLMTRECQAVFEGHTNKINCLLVSSSPHMPARLYTGSSDQTVRCFSIKSKKCLEQISLPDRVLCLHIAWNILYAGLADGSVASYDLKTLKQLDVFECHGPRGVSCLGSAQEGARRVLLVGSYDSTISVRDAKSGLLLRSLEGHTKTVLCMKVVNDLVFSGSSDTSVHAHNIHTGELVRIYKGHGHAVTSIVILGKVMVTACLDKLIRVYELQSHDRLQVYGGHSDMVMCMTVHKSVIYTGCYDGSVQAVKLNLMKNYRCRWQNCSLIFGMAEHLVQHLVGDHSNPNQQTVRCRWRSCHDFFATQHSVRQELPEHMRSHVESDGEGQP